MPLRTHNQPAQTEKRKYLRSHSTSAEAVLWMALKARKIEGVKFRRQFSIGPYILDFYAPELRLCIELDGAHHFTHDGIINDNVRSEYLMRVHDIHILRFENDIIFKYPEGVVASIQHAIQERRMYLEKKTI